MPSPTRGRGLSGAHRIAARANRFKPDARPKPPLRHGFATSPSGSDMDADGRRALAARVLERSRADATEAIVTSDHRALTRFTHEFVHQNVDIENVTIRVRAIVDGRTGV